MRRKMKTSVAVGVFAVAFAAAVAPGYAEMVTNTFQRGVNGLSDATHIGENGPTLTNNNSSSGWSLASRSPAEHPAEVATVIKFEGLGIPFGSTIHQATLSMRKDAVTEWTDDNGDGELQLDVAGLLIDCDPGEATGTNATATTYWNTVLARAITNEYIFDSTADRGPVNDTVSGITSGMNSYISWDVTESMSNQFEVGKLYGWVIHSDMPTGSVTDGQALFRDWEFGQDWAPTLYVIYEANTFEALIEASDDLNWSTNNLQDFPRGTTLGGLPGDAQYRVTLEP